jgi:chromosome segregation ATPase
MFITKENHEKLVSDIARLTAENEALSAAKLATETELQQLTEANAALVSEKEAIQAETESLRAENEQYKQAETEIETTNSDLKAQLTEAKGLVAELRELKNTWKPDARAAGDGKGTAKGTIDLERVNEVIKIQNQK